MKWNELGKRAALLFGAAVVALVLVAPPASEAQSPESTPPAPTDQRKPAANSADPSKPEWATLALGIYGSIVATLGAIVALLAWLKAQKTASVTRRIEVEQYLVEGWDLMGGKKGTTKISSFSPRWKLELGRREIDKALIVDPKSSKAHRYKGVYYVGRGKLEEAIAEFHTAIRLDPDNAEAHNSLGYTLQGQGKLEEAIDEYRTAIRLDPDDANTHNNLGAALYEQGKLEEATAEFRAAIRLDPDPLAHNNLGNALRDRGKLEEAQKAFDRAKELGADH